MTTILIVEDNEMNRDMLGRRLQRRGYVVEIAVDGQVALEMVAANAPDLILMDLSLPNLDGWETTRRLKGDPATSALPIIVLTAHALEHERRKAMDTGCDDFDVKPIDFARLLSKIERFVAAPAGDQ